eukprot:744295-Pelagomonas_calceolata.AAC.1
MSGGIMLVTCSCERRQCLKGRAKRLIQVCMRKETPWLLVEKSTKCDTTGPAKRTAAGCLQLLSRSAPIWLLHLHLYRKVQVLKPKSQEGRLWTCKPDVGVWKGRWIEN